MTDTYKCFPDGYSEAQRDARLLFNKKLLFFFYAVLHSLLDQGLNPCPLHWEAQSLNHWTCQRSPINKFDIHAPNPHSSLGPPSPQSTSCSQALGGGGRREGRLPFPHTCSDSVLLEKTLESPLTARRSNQSILKEISPEYALEGLMLKLKLQYFGHLMRRADSFEKTLMLGKTEGRRRRG